MNAWTLEFVDTDWIFGLGIEITNCSWRSGYKIGDCDWIYRLEFEMEIWNEFWDFHILFFTSDNGDD